MDTLECRGLTKAYGKKEVLKNVDLTLEKGKIYGLIGRNGAGKTTLLSLLTAQNPATAGTVTLGGMPVWENEKALSHLCFSRELGNMGTTGPNAWKVKEYLKAASIYLPHWDKGLEEHLVKKFELDVKQRISRLSKGMMSMVTILVAMASKADFTFLDEPTAGLDIIARQQFYKMLLEEFEETGRTFVISTHIIEEASDVFDQVIMLRKGQLLLKEETGELLERCVHVSGRTEAVEAAIRGLEVHGKEQIGRSSGATVLLKPGERIRQDGEITVQPMNLESLFVALCGEEE
ncbi:MAG: ABC transporter ATP-binding protein [Candidatus Limivivens sp.]|nr:ABC transporter ATP-binding protein [Candidatus Limivivens sp.]